MTAVALKLAAREIPDSATCLLYARVSTTAQAESDRASLLDQEQKCRALAAKLGYPTPVLWSDPGVSGTNPARLEALATWCEAHPRHGKRGLVVCFSPDRFARLGTALVGFYSTRLDRAGWELRYVDLDRTGNALVDGVSGSLRAELAAEESRIKSTRALVGMPQRAKLGHWQGGKLPPAWVLDADGRPVPGSAGEQARVLSWFERCDRGEQLADIAAGALGIHRTTLRRVLTNPLYGGRFVWGRRGQVEPVTSEVETWIPVSLFKRVQARLSGGRPRARRGIVKYPLSGLVTCTKCEATLVAAGGAHLKAKHPERERGYRHSPMARKGCSLRINQSWLEGTVLTLVGDAVAKLFDSGEVEKGIDAMLKTESNTAGDRVGLEREKRNLDAQRSRLVDAIADGTLTKDDAKAKLDALKGEAARIDAALSIETSRPSRSALAAERAELLAMAKDFPARLRAADAMTARLLLLPWVESITATPGDRLTVKVRTIPQTHTTERTARRALSTMTLTTPLPKGRTK